MATSSILGNIKIENPESIKQYADAMDTPAKKFQLKGEQGQQ